MLGSFCVATQEPGVVPPGCLPPPKERDDYANANAMREAGR
jgi:hypothetical protein